MIPRVLIAGPDRPWAAASKALEKAGCKVRGAVSGEAAVKALMPFKPDILITELELPGISGFGLLDLVRGESAAPGLETRVIIVTSEPSREGLSRAFEKGAEDFLVRPFDPRELVARVEAVLRRAGRTPASDQIRAGGLTLLPSTRQVLIDGHEVRMTGKEFGMLHLLVQKAGRVLQRDYLLQYLWGVPAAGRTRTVDMHMANIRKKLGRLAPAIETIKGSGYLLRKELL